MVNIKISVIIPVYNMELFISNCLDSVIYQTLKEIEIICINDGSTDASYEILNEYADKDNRVKIISQNNQGVSYARNNGINAANGEFVCFMDPDDFYPDNTVLYNLYVATTENKALICGGSWSSYLNGRVNSVYSGEYVDYTFHENKMLNYSEYQYDYGYQRFIYNLQMLKINNIYFPAYLRFQDPPFFVKAMIFAQKFYAITQITYRYRLGHQDYNWSKQKTEDLVRGLIDNLRMSKETGLEKLHAITVARFSGNHLKAIMKYLDERDSFLLYLLILANSQIDFDLLSKYNKYSMKPEFGFLLEPLYLFLNNYADISKKLLDKTRELNVVSASRSYRLGRILTWFPRKLRGLFFCLKKKGLIYTIKRLKYTFVKHIYSEIS